MNKEIYIPKEKLKKLYEKEKLTTYQIADIFNCCQATIWKRIHKYKIQPRPPVLLVDLSKEKLYKWYNTQKLSTWKIEKKYKYCRSTVYRKLKENQIKPRDIAESHILYPRKDFSGDPIEKAYLIGFKQGDLRVRTRTKKSQTIYLDCESADKNQTSLIKSLFFRYGRVKITHRNKTGKIYTGITLNKSFRFLLNNKIDDWILKHDKYFFAFLSGFIDAEGCFFINKKNQAAFALGNYNKKNISQIRSKLSEFKIPCRELTKGPLKGSMTREGYYRKGDYWSLRIFRKKYLLILIGLLRPYLKHRKRIKQAFLARINIAKRNKKFGNLRMET